MLHKPNPAASDARRDPLAHHLARGRIGRAQYLAGCEYRKLAEIADDAVLTKCRRELGDDGSALVDAVLVCGLTVKQVAESRGLQGAAGWDRYYHRRFQEALMTLARVFGFAH